VKFLVDAQLPPAVARWLRDAGHDAQAVREAGLREAEDDAIWKHALAAGAAIITKDEDFPTPSNQHPT
jgi:predicted nuclease of predicted toxin-antitoxin system